MMEMVESVGYCFLNDDIIRQNINLMLSYCLKRRKDTESKIPNVARTKKQKNNTFVKMCSMG